MIFWYLNKTKHSYLNEVKKHTNDGYEVKRVILCWCEKYNSEIISKQGNYCNHTDEDRVVNSLKKAQHFLTLIMNLP